MLKMIETAAISLAAYLMLTAASVRAQDNSAKTTAPNASPYPTGNIILSPFGLGGQVCLEQKEAIGCLETRTFGAAWEDVEPEKGTWTWDKLDKTMDDLSAHHIDFGGWFIGQPKWVTPPVHGFPVDYLSDWSTYVSQIVKHVHGRAKYWEVWNEPPNGGVNRATAAQDYPKIMVSAYDAAHAADPTCLVGMAAASVNVNFLEHVIDNGAKDHFDYITVHPYETLGGIVANNGSEAVYMNIVPTIRKMLAVHDPAKVNVPIVFTELGCDANRVGADVQAYALVKAYTMGIAEGVSCIDWYRYKGDGGMALIDDNGTPRPAFEALGQMIRYLGQNPTYLGWVLLNGKDYAFVFQGVKGPVLITWASKIKSDNLDFGLPVNIVDPLTGTTSHVRTYTLTVAPIIIDAPPEGLIAQAGANKTKPFPWGGDYTYAKSVSVTFGKQNVEKGLHTQSGDAVAADILAYGNGARPGDIPGSATFMVDPNFLTYTSTPIEISAVVRLNPHHDPAHLTPEYEGTNSDFKKLPAYEVPDNDQWNTATWKVSDEQFVGMWGFSFRFNNGNYYVKSVTVTKIGQ
jgi:hypothetical protein